MQSQVNGFGLQCYEHDNDDINSNSFWVLETVATCWVRVITLVILVHVVGRGVLAKIDLICTDYTIVPLFVMQLLLGLIVLPSPTLVWSQTAP